MMSRSARYLLACALLSLSGFVIAAEALDEAIDPSLPRILSLREQAAVRDAWLARRLDTIVPMLMRREGIDMWLMIAREYDEDPVAATMLPSTWLSARRRTVLMFFDPGEGRRVERFSISRYPVGDVFEQAWAPDEQPDQWTRIAEMVAERKPRRIALNSSRTFALADGLSHSERTALLAALGKPYTGRIVSGERLALGWLETRTPEEVAVYPAIVRIAHAIIAEGLSESVITPGITTTGDVQWWYRERIRSLGLETWFHPSVSIQRAGQDEQPMNTMFAKQRPNPVIQPGDLLHVDFGILYLGLATDTQHHAYVLKPGESDAPQGLKDGLAAANRATEIVLRSFRSGSTGNDMLLRARADAGAAGLEATIYSHPIGYHGHGGGPWIGMWDNQSPQPGPGEYVVQPHTAWSIELNVRRAVPEWGGKQVRFMSEEDAFFDGERARLLDGRQGKLHLVPRRPAN
jgi:Xaa-Pro aminopeptidase